MTDTLKGGLLETAQALNLSPYEVLIVASLLQKEAQPGDFAKVARVIYNRLNSDYDRLEFDSTVNYSLARQEVATTGRRPPHRNPVEHLRQGRVAGHPDLLAER